MSNPNPPPAPPRWFPWVGVLALAGYGLFLAHHGTVAAGGSDSSGYLNSARLLASGHLDTPLRLPSGFGAPEQLPGADFQPLGFLARSDPPRLVPTYPTGLPLQFAFAATFLGWTWGPLLVAIAAALAAVGLAYMLGRELGLHWTLAAAAAVVLAASPVFLFASFQPLSDTPATAWCLAAVFAALRSGRRSSGSTGVPPARAGSASFSSSACRWAMLCGAAFGMAVLVRPTNLVLLPALVVLLGSYGRPLVSAALAGLPFAAWLASYNHHQYGGVLQTGYPPWRETFDLAHLAPTARRFLGWLAVLMPTVLLVLPLAARRGPGHRGREWLALALWFGAITGLYLCYPVSQESWLNLRFILPAFPALILMGMLGVEALARFSPFHGDRWRAAAAVILAGWAVGGSWHQSPARGVFHVRQYEAAYTAAGEAAREQFAARSIVLCFQTSGAVHFYTGFPVLRWDRLTPDSFAARARAAQQAGLAVHAVLFPQEEKEALAERCPGPWRQLATVAGINLWQLEPGGTTRPNP